MTTPPTEVLICPECRRPPEAWPLDPATLTCTNPACAREYPWIDPHIPLVVDGPFEPFRETDLIGDLEPFDTLAERVERLELGGAVWDEFFRMTMYVTSHYAERPNPLTRICDELLPVIDGRVRHAADLGCGTGGLAIEVANRTGAVVVGLDSNATALRWAELAARGDPMVVPIRRTARRYEMRPLRPPVAPAPGSVRWVCGNLLNPPLEAEAFDLVMLVNVLDTLPDPYVGLGQASALLHEGGYLILAQPDAWMSHIAPAERWLADDGPGWDAVLSEVGLRTLKTVDSIGWVMRRTDRVWFGYDLHARIAVRGPWRA